MNQEKIMKAKMVTAIFIALAAVVAVFVFAGLYFDQRRMNRLEYIDQYENNILLAEEETATKDHGPQQVDRAHGKINCTVHGGIFSYPSPVECLFFVCGGK